MKRTAAIAIAAAVCAAFALPASASAPKPQISDPGADWGVASQDIRSVTFSATKRLATINLQLTAAPQAGVATGYGVGFQLGCDWYDLDYSWTGVNQSTALTLNKYNGMGCGISTTSESGLSDLIKPDSTAPATAAPTAHGVRFTFATFPGLRPGVIVQYMNCETAIGNEAVGFGDGSAFYMDGDYAFGTGRFTLPAS